jgi:Zn-dependent protease with chaperone function
LKPHESVAGRLYAPGEPAQGRAVSVAWRDKWLVVSDDGDALHTLTTDRLRAEAKGFNSSQLALGWDLDGGEAVLMLDDAARATLAATAPAVFAHRLEGVRRVQKKVEHRFRFGFAVLAVVLALPLLLLGLMIAYSDPLAAWVVKRIPPGIEQQIGESVLSQTRAGSTMLTEGPAYDALQEIGQRLAQPGVPLQFHLADRPEVNAFASPGGVVVVFSGLMRTAGSAEEVAGVLAHEIAHVELRHSMQQLVKAAGTRVMFYAVLGDYGALADWGAQLTELKFSRDAERDADRHGVQRMVAAGLDPSGMTRFFAKLQQNEGGAPPALLSTHPATAERLQALNAAIANLAPTEAVPLAIDWTAVQAALPQGTDRP